MKLSELVYRAVKNAIFYDNTAFNYDNFKIGNFDNDPDYATNLNNVYSPLNEAISRLSDLNRIGYRIACCNANENGVLDLSELKKVDNTTQDNTYEVKEVINVANGSCTPVDFTTFGIGKIKIEKPIVGFEFGSYITRSSLNARIDNNLFYVEFKEDIPYFDRNMFNYSTTGELYEVSSTSTDVNLKDYGITDSMCNYIIEYIMGRLVEQIDVAIANMHITRAEQYFANLPSVKSAFKQTNVQKVNKIW